MKVSLGCDHGALVLKHKIAEYLMHLGHEVVDYIRSPKAILNTQPRILGNLSETHRTATTHKKMGGNRVP